LLLLTASNWQKIEYPILSVEGRLFSPTNDTLALTETSNRISQILDEKPLVTQWWGSIADIVYILDTYPKLTTYSDSEVRLDEPFIFAMNTVFADMSAERLQSILNNCSHVERIGIYLLGDCHVH
jgi:hypothetical protein